MINETRENMRDNARAVEEQQEQIKASQSKLNRNLNKFEAHLDRRNRILENLASSTTSKQARALLDEEIGKTTTLRKEAINNYNEGKAQLDQQLEELSSRDDAESNKEKESTSDR